MSVRGNGSASRNTKSVKNSRKLSARMDSEVVDAFKLFDRDKDGKVTREEIVNLIESLDGDSTCPHVQVVIAYAINLDTFNYIYILICTMINKYLL